MPALLPTPYSPNNQSGQSLTINTSPLAPTYPRKIFQTPWNTFGLSRKYLAHEPPRHDPDDHVVLTDLIDNATNEKGLETFATPSSFHPYPNKNSFLLGDWFWCGGSQKSQESFHALIDIVGNPDFNPADVRHTQWDQINTILGECAFEGDEWEDEDAGWLKTPITINVPIP